MNLNTKLILIVIAMLATGGVYVYVDNSKTIEPTERKAHKEEIVIPPVERY